MRYSDLMKLPHSFNAGQGPPQPKLQALLAVCKEWQALWQPRCGRSLTSQRAGVPEGADLWVREAGEQRDHRVHHVLVVDDAVLALPDQHPDELAEVGAELLPLRPGHGQGIIATVLQSNRRKRSSVKGLLI